MYCASTDIVNLVPEARIARMLDLGDEDTVPQDTIEGFIIATSNDINAILAPMYVIPITGPLSLAALIGPCAKLTVETIYKLNSEGKVPDGVKDQADQARDVLKSYLELKTALPDAQRVQTLTVKSFQRRRIETVFGGRHEDRE